MRATLEISYLNSRRIINFHFDLGYIGGTRGIRVGHCAFDKYRANIRCGLDLPQGNLTGDRKLTIRDDVNLILL